MSPVVLVKEVTDEKMFIRSGMQEICYLRKASVSETSHVAFAMRFTDEKEAMMFINTYNFHEYEVRPLSDYQ